MNSEINKTIDEFIRFLKFTYLFNKKTKTIFYISDKNYFINIIVNDNKELIIKHFNKDYFNEKIKDYNYDLYFDITENLLIKLYKEGVSIKELLYYIKNGKIKTNNFGIFKFYSFMKNFNFSIDSWQKFIKSYK